MLLEYLIHPKQLSSSHQKLFRSWLMEKLHILFRRCCLGSMYMLWWSSLNMLQCHIPTEIIPFHSTISLVCEAGGCLYYVYLSPPSLAPMEARMKRSLYQETLFLYYFTLFTTYLPHQDLKWLRRIYETFHLGNIRHPINNAMALRLQCKQGMTRHKAENELPGLMQ